MMSSAPELIQKRITPSWKEETNRDFNCMVSRDTEGNSSLITLNLCSTSTSKFHLCNWHRNMKRSELLHVSSVHDGLVWIENLNLATSSGWFTMSSSSRRVLHQNLRTKTLQKKVKLYFLLVFEWVNGTTECVILETYSKGIQLKLPWYEQSLTLGLCRKNCQI